MGGLPALLATQQKIHGKKTERSALQNVDGDLVHHTHSRITPSSKGKGNRTAKPTMTPNKTKRGESNIGELERIQRVKQKRDDTVAQLKNTASLLRRFRGSGYSSSMSMQTRRPYSLLPAI